MAIGKWVYGPFLEYLASRSLVTYLGRPSATYDSSLWLRPLVATIGVPEGRNKLDTSMAADNNPPGFVRKSKMMPLTPASFKRSTTSMSSLTVVSVKDVMRM